MVDNDGNLSAGGTLGVVALFMGPVVLAITLTKLFFRAPLAAMLGASFCAAIVFVGLILTASITADMNPLGGIAVMGLMLCLGAGVSYGIASSGWLKKFFGWECSILDFSLRHCGILGRAFYVLAQIVPSLLLVLAGVGTFIVPTSTGGLPNQTDLIIAMIFMGWLLISQVVVLKFHRADHPVGHQVTFTGAARLENDSDLQHDAQLRTLRGAT